MESLYFTATVNALDVIAPELSQFFTVRRCEPDVMEM
jgi:hypothetical protein